MPPSPSPSPPPLLLFSSIIYLFHIVHEMEGTFSFYKNRKMTLKSQKIVYASNTPKKNSIHSVVVLYTLTTKQKIESIVWIRNSYNWNGLCAAFNWSEMSQIWKIQQNFCKKGKKCKQTNKLTDTHSHARTHAHTHASTPNYNYIWGQPI